MQNRFQTELQFPLHAVTGDRRKRKPKECGCQVQSLFKLTPASQPKATISALPQKFTTVINQNCYDLLKSPPCGLSSQILKAWHRSEIQDMTA
jgi:hypothetical protein